MIAICTSSSRSGLHEMPSAVAAPYRHSYTASVSTPFCTRVKPDCASASELVPACSGRSAGPRCLQNADHVGIRAAAVAENWQVNP